MRTTNMIYKRKKTLKKRGKRKPGDRRVAGVRPYTETDYEVTFAKALVQLGQFSYHTAERFYIGIPDRYVSGGRWVEFKQIVWMGNRPVSPILQFRAGQIKTLDLFTLAGDDCWVAVLFQTPAGDISSVFMPWPKFRTMKKQWTRAEVRERSTPWIKDVDSTMQEIMESGFNNGHPARDVPENKAPFGHTGDEV